MTPPEVKAVELFAWVGEDELGGPGIGLKQARVPAGYIPLVAVFKHKMIGNKIPSQLQTQVDTYGKTIRLCRFVFAEELITLIPK